MARYEPILRQVRFRKGYMAQDNFQTPLDPPKVIKIQNDPNNILKMFSVYGIVGWSGKGFLLVSPPRYSGADCPLAFQEESSNLSKPTF